MLLSFEPRYVERFSACVRAPTAGTSEPDPEPEGTSLGLDQRENGYLMKTRCWAYASAGLVRRGRGLDSRRTTMEEGSARED